MTRYRRPAAREVPIRAGCGAAGSSAAAGANDRSLFERSVGVPASAGREDRIPPQGGTPAGSDALVGVPASAGSFRLKAGLQPAQPRATPRERSDPPRRCRLSERLVLEVGILQDDQLVLVRVVPVLLVVRQLGQGDVVLLDDLLHELVVIPRIA